VATAALDALRARVYADAALAERLRAIEPDRFIDEVARIARELGCDVSTDELRAAIAEARHAWMLRWTR
jgi:hypothetical protein